MKILAKASLFLALASCSNPESSQLDIINGRPVGEDSPAFASVVGLVASQKSVFCSGTLIARDLVLTAAHCVEGMKVEETSILFGQNLTDAQALQVPAKEFHMFRKEGAAFFPNNDMALVKLSAEAPAHFQPAEILRDPRRLKDMSENVLLAGYGRTKTDCSEAGCSGQLLETNTRFKDYFDKAHLLSLLLFDGANLGAACNGDSGGPAYAKVDGRWYLIGVTNGSTAVVNPRAFQTPGSSCESGDELYTFAGDYLPWIESAGQAKLKEFSAENKAREEAALVMKDMSLIPEPQSWKELVDYPNFLDKRWIAMNDVLTNLALDRRLIADEKDRVRMLTDRDFSESIANEVIAYTWANRRGENSDLSPLTYFPKLKSLTLSGFDKFPGMPPLALESLALYSMKPEAIVSLPWTQWKESLHNLEMKAVSSAIDLSAISLDALESLKIDDMEAGSRLLHAKNLQSLEIARSPLDTASVPDNYAALKKLSWRKSDLRDLAFVSRMPKLSSLNVSGNKIENLMQLQGTSISELIARDNPLSEASCPAGVTCEFDRFLKPGSVAEYCKNLVGLPADLNGPDYESIINYLDGMSEVFLRPSPWTDVECDALDSRVSPLESLKILMFFSPSQDLSPLSTMKSLKTLELTSLRDIDLKDLKGLPKLKELDVNAAILRSVEPIAEFPSLESLHMSGTQSGNWSGLKSASLKEITSFNLFFLFGRSMDELGEIGEIPNLTRLSLYQQPIKEISSLSKLSNLKTLTLSGTKVESLDPVANIFGLLAMVDDTPFGNANKPCPIVQGNCYGSGKFASGPELGLLENMSIPVAAWGSSVFVPGAGKTIGL